MGWDDLKKPAKAQRSLFVVLTDEEKKLMELLSSRQAVGMDSLIVKANMPASKVASALLNLEFEGLVKSLPGKLFKLIS